LRKRELFRKVFVIIRERRWSDVNKCIDYLELLSAYIDGELAEGDKKRVEEHLETCENCSAILDLYRETSVSTDEWLVPAPEALRTGVMEKILKRPKTIRIALTRYLPVAACLAVMLATLPWIIDYHNRKADVNGSAPGAAQEMLAAAPAPGGIMQDSGFENDRDEMATARGGGDTAGGSAPSSSAPGSSAPSGASGGSAIGPAAISPEAPTNADAAPRAEDSSVTDDAGTVGNEPSGELAVDVGLAPPSVDDAGLSPVSPEAWNIPGDFGDIYALIEITGELPEFLAAYDPEPTGDRTGLEMIYRIPRAVARELIDEISARDGVDIPVINEDSEYAIVLYTP